MRARRAVTSLVVAVGLILAATGIAGCGDGGGQPATVRLGFLLNVTHGPAILAMRGEFVGGLAGLPVDEQVFANGAEEISALLGGSLDAAYVGPGPYLLAESRAPGRLRLLAGVAEGGQAMVARPGTGITSLADLDGHAVAVPAHGNTQDLTLRVLLDRAGLRTEDDGGSVRVIPVKSAALPAAMRDGVVDAALASEPYAARLVADGDAAPVLDVNRTIGRWRIPATLLVVTEAFARTTPAAVRALITANARAVLRAGANPQVVAREFNRLLADSTGKELDVGMLVTALRDTTMTTRVSAIGMARVLEGAEIAGYLGGPVSPATLRPRPG